MPPTRLRPAVALLALIAALCFALKWRVPRPLPPEASPVAARSMPPTGAAPAADPAACLPAEIEPGEKFTRAVAAHASRAEALAKVEAFTAWLTAWRRAGADAQPELAARGRGLAVARRDAMKYLIETDPKRALEVAVSEGLRAELPAEVQDQLEQRVDNRGALEVSIMHVGGEAWIERVARIGDASYRAFVHGRREHQQTKFGLPLHGIVVDGAMAIEETPYRFLDDAEKLAAGLTPEQTALLVGSQMVKPASPAELDQLVRDLVAAESAVGPQVANLSPGSLEAPAVPATAAVTSPPSWINGAKRVLWVKIDFADDPGAAFTDAEIQAGGAGASDYFVANGQNKTTLAFSILPAVLRMPKDKAYYSTSGSTNDELYAAAREAAKAYDAANGNAGAWDPDRFDRYIILHKRIPVYLYGGVGQLGGPRVGLNNSVSAGTISHELGHTQSLAHSHYWLPTGTSAVGAGTHVEYGDVFDLMGGGGITQHFNVSQKAKLGYLDSTSITTVSAAGTYRLTRHDDKDATGIRALKIAPADLDYEYWVEHRRVAPANFNAAQLDRFRNGVLLHWGTEHSPNYTTGAGTYLVDGTPGSAGGASDAPVRIGETFVDPDAGITIKPLAVGGTAPNEYIDVQVAFGAVDGNRNPTLVADLPAGTLTARSNIVFNASASDPDGDSVYYRWNFGDGSLQPNLNSVTRRFAKGGDYSVRVSAHDGKGGIAAKTLTFKVADPLVTWTRRASGLATNALLDVIYAGDKFVAVGASQTVLNSTDGVTWTRATFPSGNSLTGIAHNGARYALCGFRFSHPTQKGLVAYSDDGTNWTLVAIDTGLAQFWGMAFGAGRFVAVGDAGLIYTSVDGATWSAASSGVTNTLRGVTFADGLFVATGDAGRVLTSTDGRTWINRSLPNTSSFWGAARHNGAWYTRSGGLTYSSPDGITWSRLASSGATNLGVYRTQSVGGVLFSGLTSGTIDFGENGQTWGSTQISAATGAGFRSAADGRGLIVVVGNNGLIYSTDVPVSSPPPLPAPSLRLEADSIKVAVGKKNVLAVSGAGFAKVELYANGAKVSEMDGAAGALTWTPATVGNYSLVVRGIDASGAGVTSAVYPAVAAFANWRWRNPGPVGVDLRGAVRVDKKWWIAGGGGTLLTLDDAGNFADADFPTTQQLNAIGYANGRFVIATTDVDGATKADIGGLWTSADGYSWAPFLTGALDSANLNFVLYAANRWMGFGNGGVIVTSIDGLDWPRTTSGITQAINSAAAGNNLVVAVAAGGRIITSTNGLAWTERTSGVTTDLRGVTFANGTFVAVGAAGVVLTSPDGTSWTKASSGTATTLNSVGFVKGAFVAGGDGGVLLSSVDGSTWSAVSLGGNASSTLFVASGGGEGLIVGRTGEAYSATTAASWRRLTRGSGDFKQGLTYGGGRFVAVGQATDAITQARVTPIQYSSDGITWTRANANPALTNLSAVAFGQGRFVAVGAAFIGPDGVTNTADDCAAFTSSDGVTWSISSPTGIGATQLNAVCASPSLFVAAGNTGALLSSPDGITWTRRTSNTTTFRGAAYGNGRYVVVGDGGAIWYSTDGIEWTAAKSGVTTNLLTIGWWEEVGFIAAGNAGIMLGSVDGVTWRAIESGVAENIGAIAKTPVGYVAAGGVLGTLLVSLDGLSWSISAVPADKTIRGLTASNNAVVAVGDGGVMLTFEINDTTPPPVIVAQPVSRSGVAGETVTFSVTAQNATGAVYQWFKDGVPIVGANNPVYTITNVMQARGGMYSVSITTPTGRVTSSAAALSFGAAVDPGRLINLSILTSLTGAADNFTLGVVIGGAGTTGGKALLVRAAGPSLSTVGVTGVLDDPKLEFFAGSLKIGENDNWGGAASIADTMAQVGAFPFDGPASRDAAISLPSLASGPNSVKISGTGAGTVIAELYDATPNAEFTPGTPRLINVSVLKDLGTGVTAGFVIGGATPRKVLVRAIGPTLASFGVEGVAADPRLALFTGQTQIKENDNWGGDGALSGAFERVGAFGLAADSKDAAILVTLDPGSYTVQVSGVGGTGVALVEIYEVPE